MAAVLIIAIPAPIPARPGWARAAHCRVLAGCYETEPPWVREVYVPEQVGEIVGWAFTEYEGTTPVGLVVYVRVEAVR